MFFAETLGPSARQDSAAALAKFIRTKLGGRAIASAQEIRAIAAEYLRQIGSDVTPDGAISFLAQEGRIAQQDANTFRLAA